MSIRSRTKLRPFASLLFRPELSARDRPAQLLASEGLSSARLRKHCGGTEELMGHAFVVTSILTLRN